MPESFILLDARGRKFLVRGGEGVLPVPGLGSIRSDRLADSVGRKIQIGGKGFLVLVPSERDLKETMERGPQTLAPKDLAILLFEADIRPGAHVVEAGTGSGALTVALARAVGPLGKVVTYDLREAPAAARANVERAGVSGWVEFRAGDVRESIADRGADAVLLDIPDPWVVVPHAWDALRPCGHLASFSPNMEQIKQTVAAVRRRPFVELRTVEIIEREMEVRDVGVRPSFAALGHTGYLTFARKVLDTF